MTRTTLHHVIVAALVATACHSESKKPDPELPTPPAPPATSTPTAGPVAVARQIPSQAAVVGAPIVFDATLAGAAFSDPGGQGLTYTLTFAPAANGFSGVAGQVLGAPAATGLTAATIVARDARGNVASQTFEIVAFAADLTSPTLPVTSFAYTDAAVPIPAHFGAAGAPGGSALIADNTPVGNPITDAGATLGRVLFYDRRLSINDRVACGSCHQQELAFSDSARLSRGFAGGTTGRHSMRLGNARFYQRGRFFWDERATTLEDQVLRPIQDGTEMGMSLEYLVKKLALTPYYPALFTAAFGTADLTADRIARALAQFVRSLVTGGSKFDRAFAGGGAPDFPGTLTPQENLGLQVFNGGQGGCARCHGTNAHISDDVHNTGLDVQVTDVGAGSGRFKAPSLRNVAVAGPYMHDGRFQTLEEVVEFYDSGVMANPFLDGRLLTPPPGPRLPVRLNLTTQQKAALVAYLRTLTDDAFLTSPRFSDPFAR